MVSHQSTTTRTHELTTTSNLSAAYTDNARSEEAWA